jgi:hypothetical protein
VQQRTLPRIARQCRPLVAAFRRRGAHLVGFVNKVLTDAELRGPVLQAFQVMNNNRIYDFDVLRKMANALKNKSSSSSSSLAPPPKKRRIERRHTV